MKPAVQITGLVKYYGRVRVLDEVDIEIPEGTVLGLLGPNGAGKTTAVRIVTTLLRPN
ncbi:ATP-binding cassette domain-containing protein, partial [Nocardia testacea]